MKRLDQIIAQKVQSRTRAQDLIREGQVQVNQKTVTRPSAKVSEEDEVTILEADHRFVSRAGGKLLAAIEEWNIDLNDQTVLDIGASTGGFTQCCLDHGARKVYALDVGHAQLHPSLMKDARVRVMEKTNARYLEEDWFDEPIDFVCMDVSFISCLTILSPVISKIQPEHMAILIKPQFELGPDALNKSGVVKKPSRGLEVADEIKREVRKDYPFVRFIPSPVLGRNGNQEYILYASRQQEKNGQPVQD